MTELMFPAGIVRVDEGHVWSELGKYVRDNDGEVAFWRAGNGFTARLWSSKLEREYMGHSELGMADAVAQALQTAVSEEAA
jgi:hypothetical protein